ncbi:protein SSUH2 homolog [Glandiceps talaboti]
MAQPSAPPYDPEWASEARDGDDDDDDADESDVDITFGDDNDVPLPDLSTLGAPPGYETLGYTDSSVPPPYVAIFQSQESQHQFSDIIYLTEDDTREALLSYVLEHCCYGKRAAREMNINNILPSNALHYELVTFTEGRETKRTNVPYRGGPVDGPANGTPPAAWDIPCSPQLIFSPEVRYIEVPHTAEVLTCHRCHGSGRVTCGRCNGRGRVKCSSCSGSGRKRYYDSSTKTHKSRSCGSCHGSGKRRCGRCSGSGRVTCPTCHGATKLKWYVQLTVTYKNLTNDHVVEHTDFPNDYIREAEGSIIFNETQDRVQPIVAHPDEELNKNSKSLVRYQENIAETGMLKILKQKHQVRAVPVSEVHWTWKNKASRYWVYGQERKIYFPKYPQKCCWGCVII